MKSLEYSLLPCLLIISFHSSYYEEGNGNKERNEEEDELRTIVLYTVSIKEMNNFKNIFKNQLRYCHS